MPTPADQPDAAEKNVLDQARYRYMANEGSRLFTTLMQALQLNLANLPLSRRGQLNTFGHMWVKQGTASVLPMQAYSEMQEVGYILTSWAMDVLSVPSPVLSDESPFDFLQRHRAELDKFTDVSYFSHGKPELLEEADAYFLEEAIQFAFVSNMQTALRTLYEAPHLDLKNQTKHGVWLHVRALLASPAYQSKVLMPLAATGFAVLGNLYLTMDESDIPLSDPNLHLPESATSLSKWTKTPTGWMPELNPEIRVFLVKLMQQDGRTRFPHERNKNHDGTSSGCPVRHNAAGEDGIERNGILISNAVCIDAIDQMLAFVRMQERLAQPAGPLTPAPTVELGLSLG